MKKRIFAVLLVLALVITVGVVAVSAEETTTCPHCDQELTAISWTDWTGTKISESGHYKLTATNEGLTGQLAVGAADANLDVVVDLNGYTLSSTSRIFAVYPSCSLFLMDSVGGGEIKGKINGTSQHGCVIRVDSGATFTLHSGTVTDNLADGTTRTASYGGAIDVNGGTAYIKGGTVNGKSAKYGAAISVRGGGSLTMTAGTINGGTAGTDGGAIYNNGTVIISGGTVTGGTAGQHGGNIYNTGKLTISGTAVIENGTCTYTTDNNNYGGGNIYTNGASALLTIEGGTIQNGAAGKNEGGNIYVRSDMVMTGGTIIGGTATGDGSSIAIREYDVSISGGSITGGDVSVIRDGWTSFTVSGDPYIENITLNTHDGEAANKITLTVGAQGLAEGASIGVEADAGQAIFDAGTAASAAQYLTSTATRASAEADESGNITLVENTWCEACQADATWTAWAGGSIADVTDGSHYYLTQDITSGGRVLLGTTDVVQTMCVDFNGHSIHKGLNIRNIYMRPGTTAHLMNSSSRTSELSSQMTSGSGGVIFFESSDTNNSIVHIYDGLKLYNAYEGDLTIGGNVVYVNTDGELYMHGGTIVGHDSSTRDGAVFVGGTFNMSGGKIIGANAAEGGAIRVGSANAELNISGTAVIDGGTLTDERNGGAIYVSSGTVNVTGGTINGSIANGNGGAIYASGEESSVSISGGTVNGGVAELGGGGAVAMIDGAALEISGTALINGGTGVLGGAVYLKDSSSLTMTNGTITGGAAGQGGNIYITASTAEISGGTVKLGTTDGSTYGGGNIMIIGGTSELTVSGTASIEEGYADASSKDNNRGGGNIFIAGGTVNITGGTVKDGETDASGGNIMTRGGTLNISGTANISGGTAGSGTGYGGDSIALRDNTTVITGGTINSIAPVRDGYKTLTISGAPTIASLDLVGHVNTGIAPVVTLGEGGVTGGSINVVATQDVPFTVANAELATSSCQYFHDATGDLTVIVDDNGQLVLAYVEIPVECPHCHAMLVESDWQAWDGGAILTAGHYYVPEGGIKTSGQKQVGDGTVADNSAVDVCLDLRGNAANNTGSRMFVIRAKAQLFVMDSVGGGEITGVIHASNQKGCVIRVADGAEFTLHSGTIRDAYTDIREGRGGAIGAEGEGAIVNINGGTVTGLTASYGAAIYMEGGAELNITAGTINGGTATSYGGAVALLDNSSMTMSGGTINGGTAHNGGSVYADSTCSVTISNEALITSGKAINDDAIPYGGNIYCAGPFTMTGGTVSNGLASSAGDHISRGGNIYVQGSANVHTISGGTISGGNSSGNGGNIYIGGGTLNISGDVVITDGESHRSIAHTNGGGNVYGYNGTTINITGGTITNGTTASLGGNVFARGTLTISSAATISGSSSEHAFGCDVASSGGEMTIEGLGEAWSGRIALTNGAVITNNNVGVATTTYYNDRAFDVWYSSVDAAKAADTEEDNTYLALTANGVYDLDGHVVDLRGYSATINGAATCFDSENDDYEGYGIATLSTAPQTNYIAHNGNLYITVAEEGENQYSFHRITMAFENISLRPSAAAVYYSASWRCDDVLAGTMENLEYTNEPIVQAYGLALKKGSAATAASFTNGDKFAYTYFDNYSTDDGDLLCNNRGKELNSCLLSNIVNTTNGADVNQANAQVQVYVSTYIKIINYLGQEEYIVGDPYNNSLKGIVEYFVATIDAMADGDDKAEFVEGMEILYNTWCVDENLGLNNDFFAGLEALVNPTE